METRLPAILIPNPKMSDQIPRASAMHDRGLVGMLDANSLDKQLFANQILASLETPMPRHDIRLDGSEQSANFLETI